MKNKRGKQISKNKNKKMSSSPITSLTQPPARPHPCSPPTITTSVTKKFKRSIGDSNPAAHCCIAKLNNNL